MTDEENLEMVIHNWCNAVGCRDCMYKKDDGTDCRALELQDRVMDRDMAEFEAGKSIIILEEE